MHGYSVAQHGAQAAAEQPTASFIPPTSTMAVAQALVCVSLADETAKRLLLASPILRTLSQVRFHWPCRLTDGGVQGTRRLQKGPGMHDIMLSTESQGGRGCGLCCMRPQSLHSSTWLVDCRTSCCSFNCCVAGCVGGCWCAGHTKVAEMVTPLHAVC